MWSLSASPVHDLVEDEVGERPVDVLQVLCVFLLQRRRRRGADFHAATTRSTLQGRHRSVCVDH